MPTVSIIVAMDEQGLIGSDIGIPWTLPRDLRRFRTLTMGKPIVMGRKTHEQIGRALPGRTNIVLTRQRDLEAPGCVVAHSAADALAEARKCLQRDGGDEIMVIGGADIYREFLPHCRRIYLTVVEGEFEGNTWFPARMPAAPEWTIVQSEACAADEKNAHAHRFTIFERQTNSENPS